MGHIFKPKPNSEVALDLDVEATERFKYTLYIQSQLRMWENEFYQYQIGLFDSDGFEERTKDSSAKEDHKTIVLRSLHKINICRSIKIWATTGPRGQLEG